MQEISASALKQQLAAGADICVLDVREAAEFTEYPLLVGAVHIPLVRLPLVFGQLPLAKPIVVVCRGGVRSAKAVAFLTAEGYTTINLLGGMAAVSAL